MFLAASNTRRVLVAAVLLLALSALLGGCIWSERPLLFEELGETDTPLGANRTYSPFTYQESADAEPTVESDVFLTLHDGVYTMGEGDSEYSFRLYHVSRIIPELPSDGTADFFVMEGFTTSSAAGDSTRRKYGYDFVVAPKGEAFFSLHSQSCKDLDTNTPVKIFTQYEVNRNDCEAVGFEDLERVTAAMLLRWSQMQSDNTLSAYTLFMPKK